MIAGVTTVAVLGLVLGLPSSRARVYRLGFESRRWFNQIMGFEDDRQAYESQRDRDRAQGIAQTRAALRQVAIEGGPPMAEFLRVAGMESDSAVVRWGNFDWTLALSSAVFEADDAGRSYRLRPLTRSVWLIGLTVNGVQAMFEIPETPEARRLGEAVGGRVVPESVQTTNSWGCRGPEPDPNAALRGIVLGDSNMQGLLVGDDQTPPVRLEARLRSELGRTVSVLNTGVLGYSPEQYYYSLLAFQERFHPQFVIISLCANDFGAMDRPENWTETEYWLDKIAQYCRTRKILFLAVPLTQEDSMTGRRNDSVYPAQISRIFDGSGQQYLDPIEEFTTTHLSLKAEAVREGRPFPYSPLFNRRHSDHHLSPLGCDLWAKIVARRLRLIWETMSERPSWISGPGG